MKKALSCAVLESARYSRRTLTTHCVRTVAVTGGTHGNELNGVYLAQYFIDNPSLLQRPSFETTVLLTNVASCSGARRAMHCACPFPV